MNVYELEKHNVCFLDFENYYSFGCMVVKLERNFHVRNRKVRAIYS